MTYLDDPRCRAAGASAESRREERPRPPEAAWYAPGGLEGLRTPAPAGAETGQAGARGPGAESGQAGARGPACTDCDLGFGRHVHLHLRPLAAVVADIRAAVGANLSSWGCPSQAIDDSLLLTSELVGNAIKHAPDGWITLDLIQIGDHLLIEVSDGSSAQPVVHRADPLDERGRGMYLVQAIASAWGARRDAHGRKTIWCTLAIEASGADPRPR